MSRAISISRGVRIANRPVAPVVVSASGRDKAVDQFRNQRTANPELALQHDAHDPGEQVAEVSSAHTPRTPARNNASSWSSSGSSARAMMCVPGADLEQFRDDAHGVHVCEARRRAARAAVAAGRSIRTAHRCVGSRRPRRDRPSAVRQQSSLSGCALAMTNMTLPSALAQRGLFGAQHRLQQVLQHRLAAGPDVDGRLHARE